MYMLLYICVSFFVKNNAKNSNSLEKHFSFKKCQIIIVKESVI